ncbi:MAG: PAS domain S-box protein [Syntrophales bacterium]|nr:PAS domain S-box protein [Syntrophales bacterium]
MPAVMAVLGKRGFVESRDYRGIEVAAVLLPIPDSPWLMVAKVDAAEAFAEWRFRSALILALLAVLLGALGALGLAARQREKKQHFRALYRSEAALRASVERHSVTLHALGDGVIAADAEGRVEFLNPSAEGLTGWNNEEAQGRPLAEVFRIVSEETRKAVDDPVAKVLREGLVVSLANHTLLIAKDGSEHPIADSGAPIRDAEGAITGVVLVFRDQSEERRMGLLIQTRLSLLEYAASHALDEFLVKAIDETGALVDSPIGFYHFVEADQKTISLQQCSTRTLSEFRRIEGRGVHYGIDQAGVWADCVHEGKPVVHNDYASLPHKKGMPQGHAAVVRELVVPVMREGRVVAVLGVGNKPAAYTDADVESVSYLADVTWHIVEQKRAEEKQRESERRFRTIYNRLPVGVAQISLDFHIQHANPAYCRMLGYNEEELLGKHLRDITHPEDLEVNLQRQTGLASGAGDVYEMEKRLLHKDGCTVFGLLRANLIRDEAGKPAYTLGTLLDITERKEIEAEQERLRAQLRQSEKLEAVGRLAGGVAHDFNNMLGVILGHAEMALERIDTKEPFYGAFAAIKKAAERSAGLTRQLLAFARRQTVAPETLDLNEVVENMLKMLRRLIGEDIDLVWLPEAGLSPVKMDPVQVDQIMANLCINARDAIAGVGKLTIETGKASFDEEYCAVHAGFIPGEYVLLAVSDDGCGMDRQTIENIFEPFFTTKELGRGTGLGLATVYGIVKQNKGFINVYSEPGEGTTFRIYLPRHAGQNTEPQEKSPSEILRGGGETVLVVEDEPANLEMGKIMLEGIGYRVLTAGSPGEALRLAAEHAGEIRLLVTDVVLPGMNGRELAERLRSLYPNLKCLFMSGYTANVIAHHGVLEEGVNFIQKPFSIADLTAKVRQALVQ